MSTVAKLKAPICGDRYDDGECVNGFIENDGRLVRRCQCRELRTPAKAKAEGLAKATTNTANLAAAVLVVRDIAGTYELFSANECRPLIAASGINPQGVVGKAFLQLQAEGLIEPTDQQVVSTDPGTHGKRITVWRVVRSAEFRGAS